MSADPVAETTNPMPTASDEACSIIHQYESVRSVADGVVFTLMARKIRATTIGNRKIAWDDFVRHISRSSKGH